MIHAFRANAELNSRSKRLLSSFFLLLTLVVSLNACVGSFLWETEKGVAPVAYQLYLSREESGGVDFEQYRSVPSGVFVECGARVQGRVQAEEQGIATLSAEQGAWIQEKAREVMEESGGGAVFARDPLSGPDQVVLSLKVDVQVVEIRTSVDSLVRSEDDSVVALKELLEAIRGVPSRPLCGHQVFAQVARQAP